MKLFEVQNCAKSQMCKITTTYKKLWQCLGKITIKKKVTLKTTSVQHPKNRYHPTFSPKDQANKIASKTMKTIKY